MYTVVAHQGVVLRTLCTLYLIGSQSLLIHRKYNCGYYKTLKISCGPAKLREAACGEDASLAPLALDESVKDQCQIFDLPDDYYMLY